MLKEMPFPRSKSETPANMLTVVRELAADLESPISAYLKLAERGPSFLLESVTGGEQVARYSFIGVNPSEAFVIRKGKVIHHKADGVDEWSLPPEMDPLAILREELGRFRPAPIEGLPRFAGGLAGYLGYETVERFEPTLDLPHQQSVPEAIFLLADTVVAFDHAFGRLLLIDNSAVQGEEQAARAQAEARLDELEARLEADLPAREERLKARGKDDLRSNIGPVRFQSAVAEAKNYIAAGDIFQVVLSQRFTRQSTARPFDIYRALRRLNPSPYMFYFDFDELAGNPPLRLIGASPEMHVRLEEGRAAMRPIAGTRPRGENSAADRALERELLADPKERAEHVMLVDLARNDLGRVCDYGSVQVCEQMAVERYSHVMHIVSHVEGDLRPEHDAFDLLRATFPAGTVSGAPKVRAMEIIAELEGEPRGPYAGAVGYISYDGSLDTCLAIRTIVMSGRSVSVQAGAGIVADSAPEREYEETASKARALAIAVEMAEGRGEG